MELRRTHRKKGDISKKLGALLCQTAFKKAFFFCFQVAPLKVKFTFEVVALRRAAVTLTNWRLLACCGRNLICAKSFCRKCFNSCKCATVRIINTLYLRPVPDVLNVYNPKHVHCLPKLVSVYSLTCAVTLFLFYLLCKDHSTINLFAESSWRRRLLRCKTDG